jgi:hypothetical protein
MGGMHEVPSSDWLKCHGISTKFHKDLFRHSKGKKGDTQTQREQGNFLSLLQFFQNKKKRQNFHNNKSNYITSVRIIL